ncbi:glycosyltransferase family 4 protein [Priestia megaterium]|uniref:glycosyltransferase family 4 protein n=1 Tax=Priestia megaterium TaxID=1404 RepID=UPI002E1ECDD6|nr:glycosyltransferase family 4 protein [Priestia megaterium]
MNKVLLLTNTIAPYRIPVLNKINENVNIAFKVWYLEEREKNRDWKINHKEIKYHYNCLPGIHAYVRRLDMGIHLNFGLFFKLIKESPDTVITSGYDALGYWTALVYCKLFRKKYVVWWGSTLNSSVVKNSLVNRIRKFFFKRVDSFITYGSEATACLTYYGVSFEKIVTGYNTVDISYFYKKANTTGLNEKIEGKPFKFLFIGQLIPRKGIKELLESLSLIRDLNWEIDIVGSGPEEVALKKIVESHRLANKVYFRGYQQKENLTGYLEKSDCLVFPSKREVWGLVVNEALATNTFVASSKYAGCTRDIIEDKKNGIIIDPNDIKEMSIKLKWCIENVDNSDQRIRTSLNILRKIHPRYYAKSVVRAIENATK